MRNYVAPCWVIFGSFLLLAVSDAKPKVAHPVMVKSRRNYFPFTSANTYNRPSDTTSRIWLSKRQLTVLSPFLRHDAGKSLEIYSRSPIEDQQLLFLDSCAKIYWKFALVHLDNVLMQSTYINLTTVAAYGVLICRRHRSCPLETCSRQQHSLVPGSASFAADTLIMTAFQRTKSVRAPSALANFTIKRVKKQFILMARRGSAIVLQQLSAYRGYL